MDDISTAISEIKLEIDKFLANNKLRSRWLNDSQKIVRVYIRKNSIRVLDRQAYECVDVANITVSKRRKGMLKAILAHIEEKGHNIYVESILNKKVVPFLERQGYRIISNDPNAIDICAIKLAK